MWAVHVVDGFGYSIVTLAPCLILYKLAITVQPSNAAKGSRFPVCQDKYSLQEKWCSAGCCGRPSRQGETRVMTGTHMGMWLRARGTAGPLGRPSCCTTKLHGKSSHVASLGYFYLDLMLSK